MKSPPVRDPVCGMIVTGHNAPSVAYKERTFYFCSAYCRGKFEGRPDIYLQRDAQTHETTERRIAYFSMEIALASGIPTYAGGLGVLAGDTLKSCADLGVPIVGVTLVYRDGYFQQTIDDSGWQRESPEPWDVQELLKPLAEMADVQIENRKVQMKAWKHEIYGRSGYSVPVILLDTDLDGNAPQDRELTRWLYGGDERYRLAQEVILGTGGVRMLRALGYTAIDRFHMNEGHASLLALELLRNESDAQTANPMDWNFNAVREKCIFTTHTPVAAGHDQFDYGLVRNVAGDQFPIDVLQMLGGSDRLNMTLLALNLSHYVNGVAKRHGEVSREMFPGQPIHYITNGIHTWTWTSDPMRRLFEKYVPGWADDPASLRAAINIPKDDVWAAHAEAKSALIELVKKRTAAALSPETLTIGFARRATQYKRADLIFSDPDRLVSLANNHGGLQFVFAGKAHPKDHPGKELIRKILALSRQLRGRIEIRYLEDYDMDTARLIVSGVDLWLNTPQRPLEASGTSGMKAALNGVPSLSTLDGWWIEGDVEGITGWSIGGKEPGQGDDASDLYRKLETIVPMFYQTRSDWIDVMRHAIALNASYFNTHRMVQQYVTNAYLT